MSSRQTTSYNYTSTTSTSSSSTSDGQTHSKSTTTRSSYTDRDGPTSETIVRETGKPTIVERSGGADDGRIEGTEGTRRIEDVTDRDRDEETKKEREEREADERYREAMEEEYAKREGGA